MDTTSGDVHGVFLKKSSAFLAGADVVLVIAAYGFPAAIAVGVMRAMEVKRE